MVIALSFTINLSDQTRRWNNWIIIKKSNLQRTFWKLRIHFICEHHFLKCNFLQSITDLCSNWKNRLFPIDFNSLKSAVIKSLFPDPAACTAPGGRGAYRAAVMLLVTCISNEMVAEKQPAGRKIWPLPSYMWSLSFPASRRTTHGCLRLEVCERPAFMLWQPV